MSLRVRISPNAAKSTAMFNTEFRKFTRIRRRKLLVHVGLLAIIQLDLSGGFAKVPTPSGF